MSSQDRVDHIVVLMLENRSFDHMLGYLKPEQPRVAHRLNPKTSFIARSPTRLLDTRAGPWPSYNVSGKSRA
jgi:hypothetical protein